MTRTRQSSTARADAILRSRFSRIPLGKEYPATPLVRGIAPVRSERLVRRQAGERSTWFSEMYASASGLRVVRLASGELKKVVGHVAALGFTASDVIPHMRLAPVSEAELGSEAPQRGRPQMSGAEALREAARASGAKEAALLGEAGSLVALLGSTDAGKTEMANQILYENRDEQAVLSLNVQSTTVDIIVSEDGDGEISRRLRALCEGARSSEETARALEQEKGKYGGSPGSVFPRPPGPLISGFRNQSTTRRDTFVTRSSDGRARIVLDFVSAEEAAQCVAEMAACFSHGPCPCRRSGEEGGRALASVSSHDARRHGARLASSFAFTSATRRRSRGSPSSARSPARQSPRAPPYVRP